MFLRHFLPKPAMHLLVVYRSSTVAVREGQQGGNVVRTGVRRGITAAWAVAFIGVGSGLVAASAAADPTLTTVEVAGEVVAGETLTAVVQAEDLGTNTTTRYEWLRCAAAEPICLPIAGATLDSYVLGAADVGSRIAVTATLVNRKGNVQDEGTSEPSVIVAPAPPPTPTPDPEPTPTPDPEPTPVPVPGTDPQPLPGPGPGDDGALLGDFVQEGVTPVGGVLPPPPAPALDAPSSPPRYMRPFPVVRIRGALAWRGAVVTLLRVTAGSRSVVSVRCQGSGCPVKRLRRGPGRLTPFHRFLPAGTRITIRVTRRNRIGKHVRLRIRDGRPPARIDACVLPGSRAPVECPDA